MLLTKKKVFIPLFFLLLFLYLLAVNFHVPLSTDDYCAVSSSNFLNILKLTYETYLYWEGQFQIVFLQRLLFWKLGLGLYILTLINAFCFCALIYGIFLIAYSRKPSENKDVINLTFILSLIWFTVSALGEAFFWKTGAAMYLWPITANLFFIYPYQQLLMGKNILSNNFSWKLVYIIFGLFVAPAPANITITVSFFICFTMGYLVYSKRKLPCWSILGFISYMIGSALFFIAPGNYARAAAIKAINPGVHISFIHKLFPFSVYLCYYLGILLLLLLTILLVRFKAHPRRVLSYKNLALFLVLSFLAAYAMTTVSTSFIYYDPRVLVFSQVLLIIAIASLLPEKYSFKGSAAIIPIVLVFLVSTALTLDMIKTYIFYNTLHQEETQRQLIIQKALQDNELNLTVPVYYGVNPRNNYHISSGSLYSEDISVDKNHWVNQCFSAAYGLKDIATENNNGIGAPTSRAPSWVFKLGGYLGLNLSSLNHGLEN